LKIRDGFLKYFSGGGRDSMRIQAKPNRAKEVLFLRNFQRSGRSDYL
jgi:hypothetical protein